MKGHAMFQMLTILQEETDEHKRLSQQALSERLEERFGTKLNRRTLRSYLDELVEAGFPLNYECRVRVHTDGTEERLMTDWYMEPQFEISELRLLCDLLAGMSAIPETQRNLLTEKLMRMAPPSLHYDAAKTITYLHTPPAQQMLYSVEMLCEAIRRNCMVGFRYGSYQLDREGKLTLEPRRREDGEIREYMVSPYEIVVSHARYYLICCKEPYRTLSNYRIDRITDIKLLENFERLPIADVVDAREYPKQLAEQLYMYSGESEEVIFEADAAILNDILDWFGRGAKIVPAERPHTLLVTVQVHPTAMQHWALQYGKYVTVLSPESMRVELAETAAQISRRYRM